MARRELPPTDAAKGVPLAQGAVTTEGGEPEDRPEAPEVTQRREGPRGAANGHQGPPQPAPEGDTKGTPAPALTKQAQEVAPAQLDDFEQRRWETILNADAGKLGRVNKQLATARQAWERTVADARRAGVDEFTILAAAARVRIGVPERDSTNA